MAALSHLSTLPSLSSRHLSFLDQLQSKHQAPELHWFRYHLQHDLGRRECFVCACSVGKSRIRKKAKSDAELFNDICEFVKSVGFPDGHVPSTKELLQHGRIDLANIVRRRGYKRIREIFTNLTKTMDNDLDTESTIPTGQDCGPDDVVEDLSSPNNDLILENFSSSLNINLGFSSGECTSIPTSTVNSSVEEELSCDLECHDENTESHKKNDVDIDKAEDISLKTEVTSSESYSTSSTCTDYDGEPTEFSPNLYSGEKSDYSLEYLTETTNNMVNKSSLSAIVLPGENYMRSSMVDENLNMDGVDMPLTTNSSSKEGALYCSNDQGDKEDNKADNLLLSVETTIMDGHSSDLDVDQALDHDGPSCRSIKSSENSFLAQKVAKFIQNGDLDVIDDNFDVILSESGAGESNEIIEAVNAEETGINTHPEACLEEAGSGSFTMMASDGSAMESGHTVSSVTVDQYLRDDQSSTEASSGQIGQELGAERRGNENEVEIDHLKFMLRQKELELSELKEQIEKEKRLSDFQSKAEIEISKAQRLILDKDTELYTAEESLSGLKEVQICYCGDGEIVEVAGSFNGWHHGIRMDPGPSNVLDSLNSRISRIWSTVLWLYPGVYEIKFIVDGHWRIDPQKESVTKGAICNNILRVER